ncbi:MAG: VCBS repeat-containing protein [Ignavibacteriaceae bacterium]
MKLLSRIAIISYAFILFCSGHTLAQTFSDVALSMGIDHTYNMSFFTGGLSFVDVNGDGLDDLTLSSEPGVNVFAFKNRGTLFSNRINAMGIVDTSRSKSILWADYDNDGDHDLLVVNQNGHVKLHRNDGPGTYTDATIIAGLDTATKNYTSACWADYDNDGYLDLYVGIRLNTENNILYHNNGDGTFTNVTALAGVGDMVHLPLTLTWFDYNNDGWQDIYCANDLMGGNTLFKNNGDGTFSDVSAASGADLLMACMGIAVGDYDNNGYSDLYLSNSPAGNRLLMNNGDGTFTEMAVTLGLEVGKISWGANFFDYDNDTDLDLFVSVSDGPIGQGDPNRENAFFINNGNGTFTPSVGLGLETDTDYSYGNAVGDFNNDGYCDLFVLNANGSKSRLYMNSGGTNNWIKINLEGTSSNRDGVGTVITVHNGHQSYMRTTHCGISFESQNSTTNTIGIGTATAVDSVVIKWPSGIVDVIRDVPAGITLDVVEGEWTSPKYRFRNIASDKGINNSYNVSFFAGGLSFVDVNRDGFDDLTISSSVGFNISAFKNRDGNRRFKDIITRLGIIETMKSRAVIWVDYDNDGDNDLYVANIGSTSHLYRNDGPGSYVDVTASSGLSLNADETTSAAWADFDNDGWLDLYVGNRSTTQGNHLYKNNGDGTFTDVTSIAGVEDLAHMPLTITWLDYNNDGWQDIYCANDLMGGNTLFKNNGDGTFTDVSASSGTDLLFAAMGLAVGDYDQDGDQDIYVSNGPNGNGMLKNNGDGTFTEVASSLGLSINKICWGANFVDYDNDSDLDLFVSVSDGPTGQGDPERQNVLFENNGDGTFSIPEYTWIDLDKSYSYGNALGDFNNDGYVDIAILNANGTKTSLWKNGGGENNWIKILLQGTSSNRDGIGSVIEVFVGGQKLYRTTHSEISYQSQNSFTNTIGVGSSTSIDSIRITWPSGTVDLLTNVAVNQLLNIVEGTSAEAYQTSLKKLTALPESFELSQNFPNPFNPSTTINYQLPNDSHVKVELFNINGEKIADLINSNQSAGYYSFQFDAGKIRNGLVSGIYLYRMTVVQSDGKLYTDLKKMVLLK